ncbi:fibronectin type-III domain-containing protein 3a-like isoform X2 [Amphibalanus amphitrite]|uniref:fibronectin type-III domain-containing protein 3a-like isoform X2 n=1 Tax=Amphibalanus amphitrite TaxID=1232801 RepID=UPI001C90EAD1|nr:fibronectin type-III domain-containing protein 3a-like isoform X2 [Amphibalanus amphitrite]
MISTMTPSGAAGGGPESTGAPHQYPPPVPGYEYYPEFRYMEYPVCELYSTEYGPATVQMVSTNSSPPMAYPVQVPPGHMMQQVVDGTGTLRHVILSPEPRALATMPPYSTSQPPPPFYPAPPPPQGFGPPPYPPHAMYGAGGQQTGAGLLAAGAAPMQQGPSPPPQQTQMPPPHGPKDQRSQRRIQRMRRKLNEKQRPPAGGSRASPSPSPSPGDHKNGRRTASEPEENGEPSGDSTSSVCSQQDDEDRAVCEFLSKLRPPQVSEITRGSALVSWAHPDVTVDQLSIAPDQLSYELSMAESRSGSGGSAPPPPAAFRRVCADRTVSAELTQLRPATTYYLTLQCSLAALQGTVTAPVSFTTLAAPPEQPRPPTLLSKTKTNLHVKWSAPADNGSRISQYVLECDAGQGFSEVTRCRSKQHTVTHLQPATAYRLRVAACNELGQGPFSELVTLQTAGLVPPPPEPPRLDEATAAQLSLSWSRRPTDDSFDVHMEKDGSKYGFLALYSGPDTRHRANGLTRNTSYRFKLRAINEEGASRWSETVSYRTCCLPPAAPARPAVRGRVHAHQARVRWEPPADTGGGGIAEYRLQLLSAGGQWTTVYSGAELEHTVTGLQPGTAHQMRVCCVGEGGLSEPSEPATVTTEAVCPGRCAPPRLHGKPRATSCHVKWAAPEFCGGASGTLALEYELELTLDEPTDGVEEPPAASRVYSGSDTECTVSTLLPGRPYRLQVRAVNRVGAGPWSESLSVLSGAGPPSPPAAPSVSARSPHALLVRWAEPASNGAAVTEYRLELAVGSAAFQPVYTGTALQHEARGLQPATAYRLRVSASNSAGAGPPSEPTVTVTPAASPAAVTCVEAEPTATSLTLSWQPPADHGAEVLHYTVEVSERLCSTAGPQPRLTVNQLAPDTVYRIRVQAVNSVGPGPFSAVYRWSTLSLPPAPPPLEVTHTAHNFVRLRWGDVKQQTERIVYSLECEAKNGEFYVVYEGSGTQFKMARLSEDTEYRLRICAANEAGEGPYSNVVSTRTTRQPPPSVRGLRLGDRTERSCTLEWLPVKSGASADQRPSYELQLTPAGRQHEFQTVYTGPEVQYRLTGLEPQTDYQARVCCRPVTGECGPFTAPLRFTTPAAPPPPPAARAAAATSQTAKAAERKPWTEQQWAVVILGAFAAVAVLLAVLVQQIMVMMS